MMQINNRFWLDFLAETDDKYRDLVEHYLWSNEREKVLLD